MSSWSLPLAVAVAMCLVVAASAKPDPTKVCLPYHYEYKQYIWHEDREGVMPIYVRADLLSSINATYRIDFESEKSHLRTILVDSVFTKGGKSRAYLAFRNGDCTILNNVSSWGRCLPKEAQQFRSSIDIGAKQAKAESWSFDLDDGKEHRIYTCSKVKSLACVPVSQDTLTTKKSDKWQQPRSSVFYNFKETQHDEKVFEKPKECVIPKSRAVEQAMLSAQDMAILAQVGSELNLNFDL